MGEKKPLKIIGIELENTRVIRRLKLDINGNLVIFAGEEGSGKSTAIDTVACILGGGTQPKRPIREGQDSASGKIKLGPQYGAAPEYVVTREWDAGGSRLIVRGANGKKVEGGGQTLISGLLSKVSFSPMAFAEEKDPRRQAETLRALVGIDFSALDAKRADLYSDRENQGRDLRRMEGELASYPEAPAGTPDVEVSIKDLLSEKEMAEKSNAAADRAVRAHADAVAKHEAAQAEIERLETALKAARDKSYQAEQATREAADALAAAEEKRIDEAPIREKLANAETINRAVRTEVKRRQVAAKVEEMQTQRSALTEQIESIDAQKKRALETAKWPVEGLGFNSDGVTFNGLPFAQASESDRCRISVAIGMALCGDLRCMLIPSASGIGRKSMAAIAKLAEENDMELLIERDRDDDGAIVLVDGEVRGEQADGEKISA